MEQRINIKLYAKLGSTASDTYQILKKAYGDSCLSRARVFYWHKEFQKGGRETVIDNKRGAPPRTARNSEMIQKVEYLVTEDPKVSIRMIAEKLAISKESVRKILVEDLGKTKVCPTTLQTSKPT